MSAHSRNEFEQLLAAHANRELESGGLAQLRTLAEGDPARQQEIDAVSEVHRLFDAERALFERSMAPLEPREEADAVYQRLARRAGRTEQALRAMALDRGPEVAVRSARMFTFPRVASVAVAAAAIVLCTVAFMMGVFSSSDTVRDARLGQSASGQSIILKPGVSEASRVIPWHAVVGARTYDVRFVDGENRTVLLRAEAHARSNVWELTESEYAGLAAHRGLLYLRIVAFDGAGFELGSSGDLELKLK